MVHLCCDHVLYGKIVLLFNYVLHGKCPLLLCSLYSMICVPCGHVFYDLYYFWYLCSMASVLYGFIPYDLCPLWPCTLWPVSFLVHVLHVKCLLYFYTLWPAFSVAMYSMTCIIFGTCAPWASTIYGFIPYDLCPLWSCTLWPVSFWQMCSMTTIL
jgi:hypothetical protein